ncbi:VOC family protein [Streptomyces sp. NPDC058751]|uniref:VOC family protein n=1 Tax=Streptomyces sp. NPDC058751 TaxID=3346623 RepID=UPI00367808AB
MIEGENRTGRVSPQRFHETAGLEDWRVVGEGACAYFRTGSFAAGARLVRAISELPGVVDDHPDVDLRREGVTVRLVPLTDDHHGLTERHLDLAGEISALTRSLDITADPSAVQTVQVTVDALSGADVAPFWRALLDYRDRSDSGEHLVDPGGRGAPFHFRTTDARSPRRNRVHIDVWVPYDRARARIAAALGAGGRLVSDAGAPSNWVLADPEGNEACVGVAGPPVPAGPYR